MRPQARQDDLLVQEVMDELVIYDQERAQAHTLNRTAAWVWHHCDGQTTVAEMARLMHMELSLPEDENVVWLALDRLERAHLLREPVTRLKHPAGVSRREILERLAWAGVGALALPVIRSIVAPTPAMAQSPPLLEPDPTLGPRPKCRYEIIEVKQVCNFTPRPSPGDIVCAVCVRPCPTLPREDCTLFARTLPGEQQCFVRLKKDPLERNCNTLCDVQARITCAA